MPQPRRLDARLSGAMLRRSQQLSIAAFVLDSRDTAKLQQRPRSYEKDAEFSPSKDKPLRLLFYLSAWGTPRRRNPAEDSPPSSPAPSTPSPSTSSSRLPSPGVQPPAASFIISAYEVFVSWKRFSRASLALCLSSSEAWKGNKPEARIVEKENKTQTKR